MKNVRTCSVMLSIPFPAPLPRGRGINAVGKFETTLKARCNKNEFETVDDAANLIGITRSEFVRWVSLHAAQQVTELINGVLDGDRYGKQDDPDVATSTT